MGSPYINRIGHVNIWSRLWIMRLDGITHKLVMFVAYLICQHSIQSRRAFRLGFSLYHGKHLFQQQGLNRAARQRFWWGARGVLLCSSVYYLRASYKSTVAYLQFDRCVHSKRGGKKVSWKIIKKKKKDHKKTVYRIEYTSNASIINELGIVHSLLSVQ